MPNITIRTQAEFDALPESFEEETRIIILNDPTAGRIIVRGNRGNASVQAWGYALVVAQDNASVEAYDNSSVRAYDNASVEAHDQAAVHRYSAAAAITLHDLSVCWDMTSYPAKISSFAEFSKHTNPVKQ
jgi:uncharacterized protein YycO